MLGIGLVRWTGVARLVPFHFSRRYQDDPLQVYAEVQGACARTVMPGLTLPRGS